MSEIEKRVDEIREMKQKLEQVQEAILIYSDAVDAATTQLRQNLGAETKAQRPPTVELPFDMQKISWIDTADRNNKPYRLATIQNNIHNPDFAKAKELLKSGGGTFRQKDGLSWLLFPKEDAIGVWDYGKKTKEVRD